MEPEKKVSTEITQKNTDPISFFDRNPDFILAYKKTEKLASAVYMVTNLFPTDEPMKWSLRKKVSDLLSFNLTYKDISKSSHVSFIYNEETKVLEIVSLLEVAQNSGLISEMNFSILKQEFSNLTEIFNNVNSQRMDTFQALSKSFFNVPNMDLSSKTAENYKFYENNTDESRPQKINMAGIKDKNMVVKDVFKKTNRQNAILSLIKKKKELTIKDISQVIRDCSEKTIQRELISFINAGILKRTGERRWSKYSLVE